MSSEYIINLVEDISIARKQIILKSWHEVIGALLAIRIYKDEIIVSFSFYKRAIYDLFLYREYFNPLKEQSKNNMGKRVGIIRTD